jgi:hypothetical protein
MFGFWELLGKKKLPFCLNRVKNQLVVTFRGVWSNLPTL